MRTKQKLNYRFHNPNTVEATVENLLRIFVEVNTKKLMAASSLIFSNFDQTGLDKTLTVN